MQKTAYELRVSDWSSDVCSSDLAGHRVVPGRRPAARRAEPHDHDPVPGAGEPGWSQPRLRVGRAPADDDGPDEAAGAPVLAADPSCADPPFGRAAVRRRHRAPLPTRAPPGGWRRAGPTPAP